MDAQLEKTLGEIDPDDVGPEEDDDDDDEDDEDDDEGAD